MKKLFVPFLLVLLMLVSCTESRLDGDWDPFKWDKNKFKNISADGATLVATLKNYDTCWLTSTSMDGDIYEGGSIYGSVAGNEDAEPFRDSDGRWRYPGKNPRLDVQIEGRKVTVVVAPNHDPVPHTFYVSLSLMDCFGPGIAITQKAHE